MRHIVSFRMTTGFNTQPPEGGWAVSVGVANTVNGVSTHSRPKAAGVKRLFHRLLHLGFNTQPPEGGWLLLCDALVIYILFQHTAARRRLGGAGASRGNIWAACFNTQPPEGGWVALCKIRSHQYRFQHTAARRRLAVQMFRSQMGILLFQHTAARRRLDPSYRRTRQPITSFNTQPPEGGWFQLPTVCD